MRISGEKHCFFRSFKCNFKRTCFLLWLFEHVFKDSRKRISSEDFLRMWRVLKETKRIFEDILVFPRGGEFFSWDLSRIRGFFQDLLWGSRGFFEDLSRSRGFFEDLFSIGKIIEDFIGIFEHWKICQDSVRSWWIFCITRRLVYRGW